MGVLQSYILKSVILNHPFSLTRSYKGVPGRGVAILKKAIVSGHNFSTNFMVFKADSLVSPGNPRSTFGTGCNPSSLTQPTVLSVWSVEIPLCISSKTSCDPDSTPNHTETQPASFIVISNSLVTMSTRVPQFQIIFKFRFRISAHNSSILGLSTVKASSQNVNWIAS